MPRIEGRMRALAFESECDEWQDGDRTVRLTVSPDPDCSTQGYSDAERWRDRFFVGADLAE
jgi:hypothetical protein